MSSSELGDLLLCQWEHLAASAGASTASKRGTTNSRLKAFCGPLGVLRTTIDDTRRRCVPGSLGLVVQFNPSHLEVGVMRVVYAL